MKEVQKLKVSPHRVEFPVGENIKCRLSFIAREKNFKGKFDTILVYHQTQVPEWRDGKEKAKRWVTLHDRYFINKSNYGSILRKMFGIALALGLDVEDFPLAESLNQSQGNITEELFETFIADCINTIKHAAAGKTYYLKTVVGNWKGSAIVTIGNTPYISESDDLQYSNNEDMYNNQIIFK